MNKDEAAISEPKAACERRAENTAQRDAGVGCGGRGEEARNFKKTRMVNVCRYGLRATERVFPFTLNIGVVYSRIGCLRLCVEGRMPYVGSESVLLRVRSVVVYAMGT